VSAPARLLALRVQGFKSFAERTTVEFGPGISAVVGPNGSGKSNLADGLRWALGEQGRALRIRKSEDVIFAGSERRAALGMADVTLVLDNSDSLFPVEYRALEIGRRLYRSGENDYLLNRQRVRLRDLVELLDAANLADNAFLFIGQGMVDQALALRPEERRPLFEEVAGVRRHERRRHRAEDQLVEAEANLARVQDIIAELRPQARRLAAQAEQQTNRRSVADELATALLLGAHARWHAASTRLAAAAAAQQVATTTVDRVLADLGEIEDRAAALAVRLREGAETERERRAAHEDARAAVTGLQLRSMRLSGDLEALARDQARVAAERSALEADLGTQRRTAAEPLPETDVALESALADADRALGEAMAELASARAARRAQGERAGALQRAAAARQSELETGRRRLADARRRAEEERERAAGARARLAELESTAGRARATRDAAATAAEDARLADEAARSALDHAESARRQAARVAADADGAVGAERARLAATEAQLVDDEGRGIARAARSRGGRRLDEELVSDPAFRAALESALGPAVRGYVVERAVIAELAGERGVVLAADALGPDAGQPDPRLDALAREVEVRGGGPLLDAIRRDATGATRRLLARVFWAPSLDVALELQAQIPEGAAIVVRDGSAVVGQAVVSLGRAGTVLERRGKVDVLKASLTERERALAEAVEVLERATAAHHDAQAGREAARDAWTRAEAAQRRADEEERSAVRALEAAMREASWADAQAERLAVEAERLETSVRHLESDAAEAGLAAAEGAQQAGAGATVDEADVRAWEERAGQVRERRERVAIEVAEHARRRREAEARRAQAEAAIALAERRLTQADAEAGELSERERMSRSELAAVDGELAAGSASEAALRAELEVVTTAEAATREALAAAEGEAAVARERLRDAEERRRAAEVAELEARLGLDAIREGLLVELAGLGELGVRRLEETAGQLVAPQPSAVSALRLAPSAPVPAPTADADDGSADEASVDVAALEAALDGVAPVWAASRPDTEPPSPGRLGQLRRRFHELGAANPFAVEEYGEVRVRLETLEAQEHDLRSAISQTRALIEELNELIATQFRATFRALESAFDRRFRQLFGGGHARLLLTDPDDLAATGVEIIARPPAKKSQPLAMLSGGERALTAVALLFAMLEVRPVPFCVLDEVDAALDEANVGRFVDALRELARGTQFVIITHNRGTIEAADALYGVTVGDDSVSRVISLRLEEAQELAGVERSMDVVDVLGG